MELLCSCFDPVVSCDWTVGPSASLPLAYEVFNHTVLLEEAGIRFLITQQSALSELTVIYNNRTALIKIQKILPDGLFIV